MINVTCAVIWFDDKILVTQRSSTMSLPLKWEFPGGKLEKNESKVDCVIREIREEINIEIEVLEELSNSLYQYEDVEINLIPYIAKYKGGKIKLAEHVDYKLVEKRYLLDLDFAAADIPIIKELLKKQI